LASDSLAEAEFRERFLSASIALLGAKSGRWWTAKPMQVVWQTHTEKALPPPSDLLNATLTRAIHAREVVRVEADGEDSQLTLVCPVIANDEPRGIIEVHLLPDMTLAETGGHVELLTAIGELAEDYYRQDDQRSLSDVAHRSGQLVQLAAQLQSGMRLEEIAFVAVNDGRDYVGCDRLWMLTYRRGKCQCVAASGLAKTDRRSNLVRSLEALAASVCRMGEAFESSSLSENAPPRVEQLVQQYCDESSAQVVGVWPLVSSHEEEPNGHAPWVIGAMVAESFDQPRLGKEVVDRTGQLVRQVTPAMVRGQRIDSLPLARFWLWAGGVVGTPTQRFDWRWLVAALALSGAVAASLLIQTEFTVTGSGELQPVSQHHLFAPRDGVVRRLHVDHGDVVEKGQLLVELSRLELDRQWVEVVGELDTTRQALSALQATRLDTTQQSTRVEDHQRTADQQRLTRRLESLSEQQTLLQRQRDQLQVHCPIGGRVLTSDVRETLIGRPVRRGQRLMTVADVNHEWELQIHLPDQHIGYVLEASQSKSTPLRATYYVATDPSQLKEATVAEISDAVSLETPYESTILIKAMINEEPSPGIRPGTSVMARVHCGRRSLAYVWLHDLYEALRYRFWF